MTPDWTDDQPIYRQLKDKVMTAIMDGALPEGEALPSVRSVSADLQINPLTASKAYQELVADGFVEKRRGLGMYVIEGARARVLEAERKRFMQNVWPQVRETIHRLGFDAEALLKNGTRQKGQQND